MLMLPSSCLVLVYRSVRCKKRVAVMSEALKMICWGGGGEGGEGDMEAKGAAYSTNSCQLYKDPSAKGNLILQ